MRLSIVALFALVVSGCEQPVYPKYETDQSIRAERFDTCMRELPQGPQSTHYNDWDSVVDACASAAYAQAQVCVENCRLPKTEPIKQ
ncbi:MAG: hypothetical protein JSR63_07995 [Proteobacteria bacterium]|nr:hypothetical protein [Pseudomonadota bacterium]